MHYWLRAEPDTLSSIFLTLPVPFLCSTYNNNNNNNIKIYSAQIP